MKKLKVVTIVGTRPEIIRLSRTLVAMDANFQHVLVHTGQNYDYELNQIFLTNSIFVNQIIFSIVRMRVLALQIQ